MPDSAFIWRHLVWRRPVDSARIAAWLRQLAADGRSPRVVLELRLNQRGATYLVGWPPVAEQVVTPLRAMANASLNEIPDDRRRPVITAGHLQASTRHRPLRVDDPEALVRAILTAGLRLGKSEVLVLQLVLGPRRIPLAVPDRSPSSVVAPWYSVAWIGDGGQLDGEKRKALRQKVSDFGFAATVRLGVAAQTPDRRRTLLLGLFSAVRVAETPGLQLHFYRERPHHLNVADAPWRWPLRLGVSEIVGLTGYPFGDDDLPGQAAAHPRQLPPAPGTTGRTMVVADVPDSDTALVLPMTAAVRHVHVVAPTGAGMSTLLAGWLTQVIAAGHGAVAIDPKGDLIDDILGRVPVAHHHRIVVLDPSDPAPVGLNPIATGTERPPELVADAVVGTFKQLYGKSVGARSQDILYAGVLTLARHAGTSLVMLPLLFTNTGLRRSLTKDLRDPLTLEPFWATFEHWSAAEQSAAVAPILNKLRPLLRPGLRGVLGQRNPRFTVDQVLRERKVLLVPLRRGVIGPEAANLLGSLLVAELWQAIQARAAVAQSERHPVAVVIDEVQDYLHLPTDLADALAEARGYGVSFTLAHQYMAQLPREMRSAVLANTLNRIVFRLPHEDAVTFEKGHPEVTAADLERLGPYEVYASLFARGVTNPYASGKTRPLGPAVSDGAAIRQRSRETYGRPLNEIEAGFAALYDGASNLTDSVSDAFGTTGRRRRSSS